MPLNVEHLRVDPKYPEGSANRWRAVEHEWGFAALEFASSLVEDDGGPAQAYGSGYGVLAQRNSVDHTFTRDYPEFEVREGDRIRFWRSR